MQPQYVNSVCWLAIIQRICYMQWEMHKANKHTPMQYHGILANAEP